MNNKPRTTPQLIDTDEFFKRAKMLREIQLNGYLNVEVVEGLDNVKVPALVHDFCAETNTPIGEFINTILRDWVIRLTEGESRYRKGILYRLSKVPTSILTEKQKNIMIAFLHRQTPDIKIGRKKL